jgi:hypothetical protein
MSRHRLSIAGTQQSLSIPRIVEELKLSRGQQTCITHIEHFPTQDARYAGFPEGLDPLTI